MTMLMDDRAALLQRWQGSDVAAAAGRLLGETPEVMWLERTHFPGNRPVQLNLNARVYPGRVIPIHAEYCPTDPHGCMQKVLASLRKSRNGQKAGLTQKVMSVADAAGLVLRRHGLDERLPGLRLLYDPNFACAALATASGRAPRDVKVSLVAHRLGKRAVLRIEAKEQVFFARLRAIKSGDGARRLDRHRSLWDALGDQGRLRIPEPLGALPEIGTAIFAALPGVIADFGADDSAAIARAISALQALQLADLPIHTGEDEARILADWLERCKLWRPDIATRIELGLAQTIQALTKCDAKPVPCHRDLHEKQILILNDTAGLLDFDTLCLSDPALDPGNLLAHLFMAGKNEIALRDALDCANLDLWRRATLFRLVMIYALTSTPPAALHRLIEEALRHA